MRRTGGSRLRRRHLVQLALGAAVLLAATAAYAAGSEEAASAPAEAAQPAAVVPMPNLLPRRNTRRALERSEHERWSELGNKLWGFLQAFDYDFVDGANHVVPETLPHARIQQPAVCGRFARMWMRMPFHDCGTYSKFNERFGCNGSLRKELPRTEPLLDLHLRPGEKSFRVLGPDVFAPLVAKYGRGRVDYALNAEHPENSGFASSIALFYKLKLEAEAADPGFKPSIADIIVYAGMLATARCAGPHVLFVPGRVDAAVADNPGLLPETEDDLEHILMYFRSNGMSPLDAVILLSSHSAACFRAGCLDSTPNKLDTAWASELLAWNKRSPPACAFGEKNAALAPRPQCKPPMDTLLLSVPKTRAFVQLTTSRVNSRRELLQAVDELADATQLTGWGGLLWSTNLCTEETCSERQWAFNNLYASSYFRMSDLGVERNDPRRASQAAEEAIAAGDAAGAGSALGAEPGVLLELVGEGATHASDDAGPTAEAPTLEAWYKAYRPAISQWMAEPLAAKAAR